MYGLYFKRVFDILFSFCSLIIHSPLLIFVGMMLYLFNKNFYLYLQERVGKNNLIFQLISVRLNPVDFQLFTI